MTTTTFEPNKKPKTVKRSKKLKPKLPIKLIEKEIFNYYKKIVYG